MIITSLGQKIVVRFARKPIWMATANSKLFRIAEHTFYSPDECKQIRILRDAYSAQILSIQEYMKHEFYIPANRAGGMPVEFINKEKERDEILYKENEEENARVAKMREELLSKQFQQLEERVMDEKLRKEELLLETGHKIDEYIREQKTDPYSFVTPENIETLIEKAIENPVSYEFYIDRTGKRHGTREEPGNVDSIKSNVSPQTDNPVKY